jgi:hypothetical protein
MQYTTDFQTHYNDHRRQMAWVNDEGWKFDPPTTRNRMRATVAEALIALATRIAPMVAPSRENTSAIAQ